MSANLDTWDATADFWDDKLGDRGNDLFQQLILPTFNELVGKELKNGCRVLDLGTGNGMIARELARDGVFVVATDYSEGQLKRAKDRAIQNGKDITFKQLDLMRPVEMKQFANDYQSDDRFDIITGSMLLKELKRLEPLASFLPKVLKENGKAVFVNLHPCFHKPAAHRVMELFENPENGVQEQHQWIKVTKYLDIKPVQSQALRGQEEPLTWFHHTIQDLLNPFTAAGLAVRRVQEPSFNDGWRPEEIQNYHNYPSIPMLFNFVLTN